MKDSIKLSQNAVTRKCVVSLYILFTGAFGFDKEYKVNQIKTAQKVYLLER